DRRFYRDYQEVTCFLAEYFPFDDIVQNQAEFFSVDIQPDEIMNEMKLSVPTVFDVLDSSLKNILSASLAYRKIDIALPDYSSFVYPALRTLEGYLKYLFMSKGIIISNEEGFRGKLYSKQGKYKMEQTIKEEIACDKTCYAIEQCYSFFCRHRNSLFHTDLMGTSRVIDSKDEANMIILKTLDLMEDTYKSIIS
ncbi:MAG: type II toxin-antitoxin system RnlA family toxin, partial [Halanaerobiales bacterium]|nr:type II toxin-antitoxin system RnlA family toxin [Halanaerobiales bacterium]